MIEKENNLSISSQCNVLGVSRSTYYYTSKKISDNLDDFEKVVELVYLKRSFYGYRKINCELKKLGLESSEKKVRKTMSKLGIQAVYQKPRLSIPEKQHKKYPYLLKNIQIERVNQAWSTDITYIRLGGNYVYLCAILDIYSRKVLSWRISNTADRLFCIDALQKAIEVYGTPEIFNTDQGSQFTSEDFISVLINNNIQISMDSKGRAIDNVYIERVWRSVKYENIFMNDYANLKELKEGIGKYFIFYNTERFHQSLGYKTPEEIYKSSKCKTGKAA